MGILDKFNKKRSFFPDESTPVMSSSIFRAEYNPTVNACVNKIANTLSILPIQLYVHTKSGKKLATFNPLFRILESPAYEESPVLFYSTMIRHILLNGNAYIYVSRANGGIVGLSICDPKMVTVDRRANAKVFNIDGRVYTEKDILHIPYPGTGYNGTKGVSPIEVHRDLVELDDKLLDYVSSYFGNTIGSRYAMKFGNSYVQKQDLTKFYAQIMPAFRKFVMGNANAGSPMVMPPDSEMQKLDQPSNVEAELHSLMKMVENQIALAFNVPPEVMDSSQSKYGSLEQKQNDFLSNCIQPLGAHICQCFEKLLDSNPNNSFFIQYEYKNLLTTDTASTINYLAKEVQSGLMTINEARNKLGMECVGEEGDYLWLPGNLIPQDMDTIKAIMAKQKVTLASSDAPDVEHNPNGDDK